MDDLEGPTQADETADHIYHWLKEPAVTGGPTRLRVLADLFCANGFEMHVRGWVPVPQPAPELPSGRIGLVAEEAMRLVNAEGVLTGIVLASGGSAATLNTFWDLIDVELRDMCREKGLAVCWGPEAKEP